MKFNQRQSYIIIIIVALLVIAGVWYRDGRATKEVQKESGAGINTVVSNTHATTTGPKNVQIGNVSADYKGDAKIGVSFATSTTSTIQAKSTPNSTAIPNLNRPIVFSQSTDSQTKTVAEKQITEAIAVLKKDPSQLNSWMSLAQEREFIGDYDGARQIWVYVTAVSPRYTSAFLNLGDLYTNYLKDYPKAEAYYMQVLKLDGSNDIAYRGLFDLYRAYKQDTTAAADILKQGIHNNANDVNLMMLLASYYVGRGDKADATIYFGQALEVAESLKDQPLQDRIQQELLKLK